MFDSLDLLCPELEREEGGEEEKERGEPSLEWPHLMLAGSSVGRTMSYCRT